MVQPGSETYKSHLFKNSLRLGKTRPVVCHSIVNAAISRQNPVGTTSRSSAPAISPWLLREIVDGFPTFANVQQRFLFSTMKDFHSLVRMRVTSSGNPPDGYRTNSINREAASSVEYPRHISMIRSADVYLSKPSVASRRIPGCLWWRNETGQALPEPMNGLRCWA